MGETTTLEEMLERYRRLEANDDFNKTLDEADARMGLDQNVFGALRAESSDYVLAKEGARAYSMLLRSLVKQTEAALEYAKQTAEGEVNE